MLAMLNGDFESAFERFRGELAGAGLDEAARNAHEFNEQMRVLETRIDSIRYKIGNGLLKAFKPELDTLSNWFDEHGDEIAVWAENFASAIEKVGKVLLPLLRKVGEGWGKIYDWVKAGGQKVADDHPDAQGGETVAWLLDALGIRGAVDELLETESKPKPTDLMSFFKSKGWSDAQAAGIVANIEAESQQNPRAEGDSGAAYGIGQWHADRQADFAKWAGHDIHGSTLEEQAAFYAYELDHKERIAGNMLRNATTPFDAGYAVSRYFERPAGGEEEARARGELAGGFVQNTTITVTGVSGPQDTANAVGTEVGRRNADLVRNIKGRIN